MFATKLTTSHYLYKLLVKSDVRADLWLFEAKVPVDFFDTGGFSHGWIEVIVCDLPYSNCVYAT
jgi:hypothetical protein